jgi:Protein of unknown function (DUF4087)
MKRLWLMAALLMTAPAQAAPEKRCGWLHNPTPANWWLDDRHDSWTLSAQGGFMAAGFDDLPDMRARGWVDTNGSYGYGCACLTVETDKRQSRITRVYRAQSLPLAQCRRDRHLPKP